MRTILTALAVMLLGTLSGAGALHVESGAYWLRAPLPALNTFVLLTNQTLAFVNERVPEGEDVPLLPPLETGLGLRLSEAWGDPWRLGIQVVLGHVETRTRGLWRRGATEHQVEFALSAGLAAGEGELALALVPELVQVGLSVGWGVARIHYQGLFPTTLPTDWGLTFVPRSETRTYIAQGPLGTLFARIFLPVGTGLGLGLEAGFRFAHLGVPLAGNVVLDLNGDGLGDPLDFTGLWLGFVVRISFSL